MEPQVLDRVDIVGRAHPVLPMSAERAVPVTRSRGDMHGAASSPSLHTYAMPIVDREEDVRAIRSLLLDDEVRLLTLAGPGGVGKTRLACEVGCQLAPNFSQGVVFVDLASVRDPGLVLPTVTQQMGVHDTGGQPLIQRLQAHLAEQEMLLILDNVEQTLPADTSLADLLAAAPRVTVLVTSRESLHLLAEQLYYVQPLALPDPEHLPPLDELARVASVALFLQRARRLNPSFQLSDANARAIAVLMVHLDGLPLAIKLAASRIQVLSPQMLLERLGQRLTLLRWEAQDLPARQHTLKTAVAWSYDHLSPEEQRLFCSLGVFAGRFPLEAVETLARQTSPEILEVLDEMSSLVDKSLVQREDDGQGGYRFRLLESVREFALEQLAGAGTLQAMQRLHASYCLALAEQAEPELTGPWQRAWFLRLEETRDNFRGALEWLLGRDEDEALRMAVALGHFWEIRGYLAEGRRWLEAALDRAPTAPPALRARAPTWLGTILVLGVDRTGPAMGEALHAEEILTEGIDLARTTGDVVSVARALTFLGVLSLQTGDLDGGKRILHEAHGYWQEAGHDRGIVQAILPLGVIAFLENQHERATDYLVEIFGRYRDIGDDWGRGVALLFSMNLTATRGDLRRAAAMGQELLALSEQSHSDCLMTMCASGVAWLARSQGHADRLARLVGADELTNQALGLISSLMQRVYLAATRGALEARMGYEVFGAAMCAGRRLTSPQVAELIDEVLEAAQQESTHPSPGQERNRSGIVLSPRELEVLQLVGEGLSNKQIARALFIAESKVRYHLTSIFNKLGVDSRTHALARAAQRGFIDLNSVR